MRRENPRERFLYRDVESRMKPFMAARRPVGGKGRAVFTRGNVTTNCRRGFREQRCAPEEIEKESAGAAPDSKNERHEAP